MRDVLAAAKALMDADDAWLAEVAHRDPDMIRDVAAEAFRKLSPKPERYHNEDCELRGDGPCYCEQPVKPVAVRARHSNPRTHSELEPDED